MYTRKLNTDTVTYNLWSYVLLDVHDEVALDDPLWHKGAAHAGQRLPAGEDPKGVHLPRRDASRLLDQLTEHLNNSSKTKRKKKKKKKKN